MDKKQKQTPQDIELPTEEDINATYGAAREYIAILREGFDRLGPLGLKLEGYNLTFQIIRDLVIVPHLPDLWDKVKQGSTDDLIADRNLFWKRYRFLEKLIPEEATPHLQKLPWHLQFRVMQDSTLTMLARAGYFQSFDEFFNESCRMLLNFSVPLLSILELANRLRRSGGELIIKGLEDVRPGVYHPIPGQRLSAEDAKKLLKKVESDRRFFFQGADANFQFDYKDAETIICTDDVPATELLAVTKAFVRIMKTTDPDQVLKWAAEKPHGLFEIIGKTVKQVLIDKLRKENPKRGYAMEKVGPLETFYGKNEEKKIPKHIPISKPICLPSGKEMLFQDVISDPRTDGKHFEDEIFDTRNLIKGLYDQKLKEMGLNSNELKLLKYLSDYPEETNEDLAKRFKCSPRTISRKRQKIKNVLKDLLLQPLF